MKSKLRLLHKFQRLGVLLFFFLLFFGQASYGKAAQREKKVLTVAFPESEGINMLYEDGSRGGIVYDWLTEIAKYTGWEYEFIDGPPEELVKKMMDGEYDLMGGMYRNNKMEQYFEYPDYSMGFNYSLLISRREDDRIKRFDINTLDGKKIGVIKLAESKIEKLKNFLRYNDLDCELKYYNDEESYFQCLDRKEVDMLLGSDVQLKEGYNVAAEFPADPYYFGIAKGEKDICRQLNEAMREIYAADPDFAYKLYDKYFPDFYINAINFSENDEKYIAQSQPIRVAMVKEQYPMNYTRDGEEYGVAKEVFGLISEKVGLTFTFVYADTYEKMLALINQGKADILGWYTDDGEAAAKQGIILTSPYVSLSEMVFKNKKAKFPSEDLALAVVKGRTVPDTIEKEKVLYYSSYEECLEAVNRGRADYTIMPSAYAEDLFQTAYYTNISLASSDVSNTKFSIGLPAQGEVALYSVLSKAVHNITKDEMDQIESDHIVSIGENKITLESLFFANPIAFILVCVVFFTVVLAAALLIMRVRMSSRILAVRLEKAEEMNQAKSDFLSRMSHEIRTPLNAIIGLTNLAVMSDRVNPELKNDLKRVDESAQFLLSLVNDVLDMAKIESNKMKLENAAMSFQTVLGQLGDMMYPQAEAKGITMRFSCEAEDLFVMGDEVRLKQILTNLLSNAVKFTDKGGNIDLTVCEKERTQKAASYCFSVKDTGMGIRKEDAERVFNSFEQSERNQSGIQGTGLGLSISSHLVELMGGRLCVESEEGKGAEFYFMVRLPFAAEEGIEEQKEMASYQEGFLKGRHILLAEDNALNAEIAITLLEMQGAEADLAENGKIALEMFRDPSGPDYDMILMDLQMPVMDGLTATRKIREISKEIPIIAMTANTFKEDKERTEEAGMNGFIPKPFDVKGLYTALNQTINGASPD